MYIRNQAKQKGVWGYVNQKRRARQQHRDLMALESHARCNIVRGLYFIDVKRYDELSHVIYNGQISSQPTTTYSEAHGK